MEKIDKILRELTQEIKILDDQSLCETLEVTLDRLLSITEDLEGRIECYEEEE